MIEGTRATESGSFVFRLWLEAGEEVPAAWRWQVHHVQTGDKRYFHTLIDVLEFVSEHSGVEPPRMALREPVI